MGWESSSKAQYEIQKPTKVYKFDFIRMFSIGKKKTKLNETLVNTKSYMHLKYIELLQLRKTQKTQKKNVQIRPGKPQRKQLI